MADSFVDLIEKLSSSVHYNDDYKKFLPQMFNAMKQNKVKKQIKSLLNQSALSDAQKLQFLNLCDAIYRKHWTTNSHFALLQKTFITENQAKEFYQNIPQNSEVITKLNNVFEHAFHRKKRPLPTCKQLIKFLCGCNGVVIACVFFFAILFLLLMIGFNTDVIAHGNMDAGDIPFYGLLFFVVIFACCCYCCFFCCATVCFYSACKPKKKSNRIQHYQEVESSEKLSLEKVLGLAAEAFMQLSTDHVQDNTWMNGEVYSYQRQNSSTSSDFDNFFSRV